ncbi:unnamed protein product [Arabidopsis halleri]
MCHHFSMISCYLTKGTVSNTWIHLAGFRFMKQRHMLLLFLGRNLEEREKEV